MACHYTTRQALKRICRASCVPRVLVFSSTATSSFEPSPSLIRSLIRTPPGAGFSIQSPPANPGAINHLEPKGAYHALIGVQDCRCREIRRGDSETVDTRRGRIIAAPLRGTKANHASINAGGLSISGHQRSTLLDTITCLSARISCSAACTSCHELITTYKTIRWGCRLILLEL